jgi:hypothetical protein
MVIDEAMTIIAKNKEMIIDLLGIPSFTFAK